MRLFFRKSLSLLLAVVMVISMFAVPSMAKTEGTISAEEVNVYILGKDGKSECIATYTADKENDTYVDNNNKEIPGVVTVSNFTNGSLGAKNYILYSGSDNGKFSRAPVVTKYIALEEFAKAVTDGKYNASSWFIKMNAGDGWETYYGVPDGTNRKLVDASAKLYASVDWVKDTMKQNYTSYNLSVDSYDDKYEVPTVLAICSYNERLNVERPAVDGLEAWADALAAKNDTANALRLFSGMESGITNGKYINTGSNSEKGISKITLEPPYYVINVEGGIKNGVEGEAGFKITANNASISTMDNWFKAGSEEIVKLTVMPDESCKVDLSVKTESGDKVALEAGEAGVYTFRMPAENVTINTVKITGVTSEDFTGGIYTISEGGEYNLGKDIAGTIKVDTTEKVTLTGGYALSEDLTATEDSYSFDSLSIDCSGLTNGGANVELRNMGVIAPVSGKSMIDFTGTGNILTISGINLLDFNTGFGSQAAIHVDSNTKLLVNGAGTLYLYKCAAGAGIGGNKGELNGDITFGDDASSTLNIFAKGTKQSALIGAGANAGSVNDVPGYISFVSGSYNLMTNSRGACVGGSAGSGGASDGTNIYVKTGANVNINVDYTGAAVGGGGYDSGNDASGGIIYIDGGSLRTYVDTNAASSGATGYAGVEFIQGINDTAITADRKNSSDETVYKCVFDTTELMKSATSFEVKVDGKTHYIGGLHEYGYIFENTPKEEQSTNGLVTVKNWYKNNEKNLYLYLTGKNHEIEVNGEKFTAIFDPATVDDKTVYTTGGFAILKDSTASLGAPGKFEVGIEAEDMTATVPVSLMVSSNGKGLKTISFKVKCQFPLEKVKVSDEYTAVVKKADAKAQGEVATVAETGSGEYIVEINKKEGTLEAGALKLDLTFEISAETAKKEYPVTLYDGTFSDGNNVVPLDVSYEGFSIGVYGITRNEITSSTENGTLKFKVGGTENASVREGETVVVETKANDGYKLKTDSLKVACGDKNIPLDYNADAGTYSFNMPSGPVTVTAEFAKAYNVLLDNSITNGTVSIEPAFAAFGEKVILEVMPAAKYKMKDGSLKVTYKEPVQSGSTFAARSTEYVIKDVSLTPGVNAGTYIFTMPEYEVNVAVEFEFDKELEAQQKLEERLKDMNLTSTYWDGKSVDVSWYTGNKTTYNISTAAEFAGVAALVNGLVNSNCKVYTGDAVYTASEWAASDYVAGGSGSTGGNNEATTYYHYGITNFDGVTINLLNSLNMSGGNYMPIGGSYLMTDENTSTKVGGSFYGILDGCGNRVTVQCDRHCSGNYGDGANVGLIGRLGAHDNDPVPRGKSGVYNIAVYGSVKANRSVGGVVGKIGETSTIATVSGCANFASVTGTDAKGTGGIVGAGWNNGEIKNCYNAGTIFNSYNAYGGIVGSNEVPVINCFNVGKVSGAGAAPAIATENGGGSYTNCYWLEGTADMGVYKSGKDGLSAGAKKTSAEMKSEEFLELLGSAFDVDSEKINSGYPVLSWQSSGKLPEEEEKTAEELTANIETTVKENKDGTVKITFTDKEKKESVDKLPAFIKVSFPAKEGSVVVLVDKDGKETILPKSVIEDGKAYIAVDEAVTVKVVDNTKEFADVAEGEWYESAVDFASSHGLFGGVSETEFAPNAKMTRAMLVTVLHRLELESAASSSGSFGDVAAGSWYADAVAWANTNKIVEGYNSDTFGANDNVTREQMAVILYRYAKYIKMGTAAEGDLGKYTDGAKVSSWAKDAMEWAIGEGIITGRTDGSADPAGTASRAEVAIMLERLVKLMVK
ncbi:MAG: S-layer homology domain-containing protein [Firmicutes bacterium]|nr:S-layer homology domain-containing protein [Bacillota bacterium]